MNKNDLKKMALMGISGGILFSQTSAPVEAAPIPGYPNQQIVQAGCNSGGYSSGEMYSDPNMGYSDYNGGYYDQGMSEGGYYQGGGNFPQADNYPDFGGYPVENGYNGASQGCGAAQGSYYSTQGPSGQGCSAMNQAPTYYSNPSATTSNQPGSQPGNLYRNYQNPQEMNQQNQMPNQQNQPQQMNQGTGSQTQQKSSYNNSRSRWYTAQADENATNSDSQMRSYSSGTSTGSTYNRDSSMKNDMDENTASNQPMMTEDDLLSQLNDQGKAMYNSLSPEGKRLALLIASRINDKNLAVREAAKKMAERRSSMTR